MKANGLDARAMFVESGYFEAEQIDDLVAQVTTLDNEQTTKAAQLFIDTIATQRKAVEESTKNQLLKNNPKPTGQGGTGDKTPTTKKEFLALDYKKQLELKAANPDILSQLD